jgi:cell shape-determining protein MreC
MNFDLSEEELEEQIDKLESDKQELKELKDKKTQIRALLDEIRCSDTFSKIENFEGKIICIERLLSLISRDFSDREQGLITTKKAYEEELRLKKEKGETADES